MCEDNTLLHRIVTNFVIQGGDPTGTGRGGESIYGPTFEDEIHPGREGRAHLQPLDMWICL